MKFQLKRNFVKSIILPISAKDCEIKHKFPKYRINFGKYRINFARGHKFRQLTKENLAIRELD